MEQRAAETARNDVPIFRDRLAEHRTVLANRRTFLAYLRTSLTAIAAGLTFIKFFDHIAIQVFGFALLPVGIFYLVEGVRVYRRIKRELIKEEVEFLGSPPRGE